MPPSRRNLVIAIGAVVAVVLVILGIALSRRSSGESSSAADDTAATTSTGPGATNGTADRSPGTTLAFDDPNNPDGKYAANPDGSPKHPELLDPNDPNNPWRPGGPRDPNRPGGPTTTTTAPGPPPPSDAELNAAYHDAFVAECRSIWSITEDVLYDPDDPTSTYTVDDCIAEADPRGGEYWNTLDDAREAGQTEAQDAADSFTIGGILCTADQCWTYEG